MSENSGSLLCSGRWSVGGSGRRGGFSQDAMVDREECELETVGDADLIVHVAQVILDDLFGRPELSGDFLVLVTLDDQGDDAQFLCGKTIANACADKIIRVTGGDGSLGVQDVGFATSDAPDAIDEGSAADAAKNDALDADLQVLILTVTVLGDNDELRLRGLGCISYTLKIRQEAGREDEHGGAELVDRHHHLFDGLCLGDDAEIVFHGKHFGDTRTENGLIVSQNDLQHIVRSPILAERCERIRKNR